MKLRNQKIYQERKNEIMEKCYECYAEKGLGSVGIKELAKACGFTSANFYAYFDNLDDLIIESTEYCMAKVEDDFIAKVKENLNDIFAYIDEIPYWTAKNHGKKYRLMYQVYTHPKFVEYGKKFFEGVNKRYTEYAKMLENKLKIPYDTLVSLIFVLVRACVHYSLFEDEFYLNSQINLLKDIVKIYQNMSLA